KSVLCDWGRQLVQCRQAGPEMRGKKSARSAELCRHRCQIRRLLQLRQELLANARDLLSRVVRIGIRELPMAGVVARPIADRLPCVVQRQAIEAESGGNSCSARAAGREIGIDLQP